MAQESRVLMLMLTSGLNNEVVGIFVGFRITIWTHDKPYIDWAVTALAASEMRCARHDANALKKKRDWE